MSAFIYNVTFDCADPRRLSTFWSAATGYAVTDEGDDFVRLRAPDQRGVRQILFFRVPEPKEAKNRMHVDLAARAPEDEIARLLGLGATLVDGHPSDEIVWRQGNGTKWVVMRDPEGNEFCIG